MPIRKSHSINEPENNVILASSVAAPWGIQFQTGFYGLTDTIAELQNLINLTLINCQIIYACLNNILTEAKDRKKCTN